MKRGEFDLTAVDGNASKKPHVNRYTLRRKHLQAKHILFFLLFSVLIRGHTELQVQSTPEHHFQSTKFRGTFSLAFICPKNVRLSVAVNALV